MTCETDCPVASPRGWWRNPLFAPLLAVALIPVLALALRAAGLGGDRAATGAEAGGAGAVDRTVSITLDDVPGVATVAGTCDGAGLTEVNERLLASLSRNRVPAAALVVGSRVCDARRDSLLPALLERWTRAGHALGNHTFSHRDLNDVSLDAYLADLERNQRYLDAVAPGSARWFRPPLLHAGDTPTKHDGLARALERDGYRMAPVTVDNQEWIFADVYVRAKRAGDRAVMERVAAAYVPFMDSVFAFFERRSVEVLGREVPQVLLLHANELNADHLDALAAMLRDRGYRFVSLAEALSDPAYDRPDPYVGPRGLSWIHRWAIGEGLSVVEEPREPDWLTDLRREYRSPAP